MEQGIDHLGVSVVFTCHDGAGNYLLARRSAACRDEQGAWDCGGGAIELHDSVEETLRKEIREEYCADVLDYEFLGYRDVHRERNGKPTHWISLDFRVLVDPAQVRIGEPHKMEAIGWFRLNAFPEPLHSQYPRFLEQYRDRLV